MTIVIAVAAVVALTACGVLLKLNERDAPRPGPQARRVFAVTFAVVQLASAAWLAFVGPRAAVWYVSATALVLAGWAAWRVRASSP